jgi:hypothetical protein
MGHRKLHRVIVKARIAIIIRSRRSVHHSTWRGRRCNHRLSLKTRASRSKVWSKVRCLRGNRYLSVIYRCSRPHKERLLRSPVLRMMRWWRRDNAWRVAIVTSVKVQCLKLMSHFWKIKISSVLVTCVLLFWRKHLNGERRRWIKNPQLNWSSITYQVELGMS